VNKEKLSMNALKTGWLALMVGICCTLPQALALYPEPGNIYYGVLRGQGGRVLTPEDGVRLRMTVTRGSGTNAVTTVVAETDIVSAPKGGPNFILRPSLDGGGGQAYSLSALRTGERVRVLVAKDGREVEVEGPIPTAGLRAEVFALSLVAPCDEDLDGDGLCDDWEYRFFNGTNLTDGTSDFDGDLLTDRMEYEQGSDPKNPDSPLLGLFNPSMAPSGEFTVEWNKANTSAFSAPSYRLEYTTDAGKPFQPVPPGNVMIDARAPGSISIQTGGTEMMLIRARQQ